MKLKFKWTPGIIIAIITFVLGTCMLITGTLTVAAWRFTINLCNNGPDPEGWVKRGYGFRSYEDRHNYHKYRCARVDCIMAIGNFGIIAGLLQLISIICLLYELIIQLPRAPLFPWILSFEVMKGIWYLIHMIVFVILAVELIMSFPLLTWTQGTYETALFGLTIIDCCWCGVVGTYVFLKQSRKKKFPFEF